MKEALERAWAHVAWANGKVGQLLNEVEEDERAHEALRLFAHLVWTERVWLDRIREGGSEQPLWPPEGAGLTVAPLIRMGVRNVEEVQGILDGAGPEELAHPVSYRNTSGTPWETPLGEILLHVAMHGSYHRGQVALILRGGGLEPVNTDYIRFVRER